MRPLRELDRLGFSIFDIFNYPYDWSRFEPAKGEELYRAHFHEWLLAEQLGYDCLFLSEHHFTGYNLLPSPNLMVAALAARTERIRLGVMVNVVPFHEPLRLAEEAAMLDLLSHGRLECGLGRGVDFQEISRFQIDFEEMRPRFEEGMEIILRAWTEEELEFHGRWHDFGPATIWPKPLQQPHPPVWCAAESRTTIEWVGSKGFSMGNVFQPPGATRERFEWYMAAAEAAGKRATPWDFMLLRNCYVAETDEQAREEMEAAFTAFVLMFRNHAVPPDISVLPDAYAYHREMFSQLTAAPASFGDLIDFGLVICGSPETVAEQLREQQRVVGNGNFLLFMNFGTFTHEQVVRSMMLFAERCMPNLLRLPVGAAV